MIDAVIKFGKGILNVIYCFFKMFPQQNKITFISRQHDYENIDFKMLRCEIEHEHPTIKCVVLTKKIHPGLIAKIKYGCHMLCQMYHLATSRIVILDTYCILASVLKHRSDLKIVQMWHALGALKQFGYSILDKGEGTSRHIAELMDMHKNYTYVCTSSEACAPFFAEAFHVADSKIKVLPLPSTDLLLDEKWKNGISKEIYRKYPELNSKKKKILYAPTFRKHENITSVTEKLINAFDLTQYEIIVKFHPLTEMQLVTEQIWMIDDFETYELMTVADFVITDYSAIVFDAVLMEKPLYFYAYDLQEYIEKRSFYIDYKNEMPGLISDVPDDIVKAIQTETYDKEYGCMFKEKYIRNTSSSYVHEWMDFIKVLWEDMNSDSGVC